MGFSRVGNSDFMLLCVKCNVSLHVTLNNVTKVISINYLEVHYFTHSFTGNVGILRQVTEVCHTGCTCCLDKLDIADIFVSFYFRHCILHLIKYTIWMQPFSVDFCSCTFFISFSFQTS